MKEETNQRRQHPPGRLVIWVFGALAVFALVVLLMPSPRNGHAEHYSRVACRNHLRQIAVALHNYHDKWRCFPPAYVADKNGRPMHSWRVLILPFFEPGIYSTEADQNLFAAVNKKYRFDEPWDGPRNRELMSQCPDIYRCPVDQGPTTETSYVVVVGPTTVFPAEKCLKIMDIADGTTNTIMVVEMANSGINWIEPRDLTFDQALRGVNPKLQVGISSHHQGGAQAVFADGSVHFLKDVTPPADLRLLLEINDGKPAPNLPGW